jgi:hypothetical protein
MRDKKLGAAGCQNLAAVSLGAGIMMLAITLMLAGEAAAQTKSTPRPDFSGEYRIQPAGSPGSKNLPRAPRNGTPRERAYTVDGQLAPLLPWARKLYDERIEAAENGQTFRHTLTKCLPPGMPMGTLFAFYPIQILQTPEQLTMLFEEGNHFRIIRMNQPHAKDPDPNFWGDAAGKWEGETLIIDTIGVRDDTTLDFLGFPHSEKLHVVERMRRLDANTLEGRVTLEDADAYARSWEAVAIWKKLDPKDHIREMVCENTRFFE